MRTCEQGAHTLPSSCDQCSPGIRMPPFCIMEVLPHSQNLCILAYPSRSLHESHGALLFCLKNCLFKRILTNCFEYIVSADSLFDQSLGSTASYNLRDFYQNLLSNLHSRQLKKKKMSPISMLEITEERPTHMNLQSSYFFNVHQIQGT